MSGSRSASSSSTHPTSHRNLINGGIIKFHNKICYCQRRAAIKISESIPNPNRLYYCCPNDHGCGFFRWWEPTKEEVGEIRARSHLFEEQANLYMFEEVVHNNRSFSDKLDIDAFHHRFTNIETILHQLKKYQFTTILMLLVFLFVIHYNASYNSVE